MASLRSSRKRKRVNYVESDSDIDLDSDRESSRPIRHSQRLSFREQDSTSEGSDNNSTDSLAINHSHIFQPKPSSTAEAPKAAAIPRRFRRPQRRDRPSSSEGKGRQSSSSLVPTHESSVKGSSPWQNLEHEILVQILTYAALFSPRNSVRFLLDTSLLCKSFHSAAISVLLKNPPMTPAIARNLVQLLGSSDFSMGTKIKSLKIDVYNLLQRKIGISKGGLLSLIRRTPCLRDLRFTHPHDGLNTIWAQPSSSKGGGNWTYPEEVFNTLDAQKTRLKHFDWNGRFGEPLQLTKLVRGVHQQDCLRFVTSLRFINLNLPEKTSELEKSGISTDLIQILADLPDLQNLEFHNCNIVNGILVPHLPPGLQRLSFVSCLSLTSENLEKYLLTSTRLQDLDLRSNQAMDLNFMAVPMANLQRLNVDMTFTDPSSFHDVKAHFERAWPSGPPSTFPPDLQELHLENLRQISVQELDTFLHGLVSSSGKWLQTASIKAIPEGTWRERAALRTKWDKVLSGSGRKEHLSKSRLRKGKARRYNDDSDESDTAEDSTSAASPTPATIERPVLANGRKWTLMLDNQRPAELQYGDGDFLDEELSGDEEWKG